MTPKLLFTLALTRHPDVLGYHYRVTVADMQNERIHTGFTHDGQSDSSDLSRLLDDARNAILDAYSASPPKPSTPTH